MGSGSVEGSEGDGGEGCAMGAASRVVVGRRAGAGGEGACRVERQIALWRCEHEMTLFG